MKCEAAELQYKTSRETRRTHGDGFKENHSEIWRTSLKEVTEWMEISPRNANVFVNQLLAEGYLETNSKSPLSLKATEKAKRLFEVQP